MASTSHSLKHVHTMDSKAATGGNHAANVEPTIASEAASMTVLVGSFTGLFRLGVV
jgi:ABC-type oligopeptide transport system substrate-binding subunit